jgi:hypothetical protein
MTKTIRADVFRTIAKAGFTLLPLHRYTDKSTRHGRTTLDGKRPLDKDWTTRPYKNSVTIAFAEKRNSNVGIRLTPDVVVIDVDPRNGGTDGLAAMCNDLGLDLAKCPHTITGSGGDHFFFKKPQHIKVVDTLEMYPGVEFKSAGRQVVAPGSIHPDSKDYYRIARDSIEFDINDLPLIPKNLLRMIARPDKSASSGVPGTYSNEDLAVALEALDASVYDTNDKWFPILAASHHATNGEGRQEFVDWSTSAPGFEDHGYEIGKRWDSLHREKNDGYTMKTLEAELRKHGAGHLQKRRADAKNDFAEEIDAAEFDDIEDDGATIRRKEPKSKPVKNKFGTDDFEEDEPDEDDPITDNPALVNMNKDYIALMYGARFRIAHLQFEPALMRDSYVFMNDQDFLKKHMNKKIERAKEIDPETGEEVKSSGPKNINIGQAWLTWPKRRFAKGLHFDPTGVGFPGWLNLWTGWGMEPHNGGSCERFKAMVRESLCDSNEESYTYVMRWLAYMFQHPEERPEVAVVFLGSKGAGKGIFGETITKIVGRHAMHIASDELLTGRFNSHLRDLLFLFADEAVRATDKKAESRLKNLITDPTFSVEAKGQDAISDRNFLHIMMSSNDEWVVPASSDERRYFVQRVGKSWLGNIKAFGEVQNELRDNNNAGYRRLLFELLNFELPEDWHPRQYPVTEALLNQKRHSMGPLPTYFYEVCERQTWNFEVRVDGRERRHPYQWMFIDDFVQDFKIWCRESNINPNGGGRGNLHVLLGEVEKLFPDARTRLRRTVPEDSTVSKTPSDGRAPAMSLPGFKGMRECMEKLYGPQNWLPLARTRTKNFNPQDLAEFNDNED